MDFHKRSLWHTSISILNKVVRQTTEFYICMPIDYMPITHIHKVQGALPVESSDTKDVETDDSSNGFNTEGGWSWLINWWTTELRDCSPVDNRQWEHLKHLKLGPGQAYECFTYLKMRSMGNFAQLFWVRGHWNREGPCSSKIRDLTSRPILKRPVRSIKILSERDTLQDG